MSSLHKVQYLILKKLRHAEALRFSELMRESGHESDTFKFHVHKLQRFGFIQKTGDAKYTLTPEGKEFANDLCSDNLARKRSIKLSIILLVRHPNDDDKYMCQERMRQPYRGLWSVIGGPTVWGENLIKTGQAELHKQTDLLADLAVAGFYRQNDFLDDRPNPIEDKLFVILIGRAKNETHAAKWQNGENRWMTTKELFKLPHFKSLEGIFQQAACKSPYEWGQTIYSTKDY